MFADCHPAVVHAWCAVKCVAFFDVYCMFSIARAVCLYSPPVFLLSCLGTLVELRQQIAVEKAMRTRLRAEIQEMDARITMMQMSVADARRSDASTEDNDSGNEDGRTGGSGLVASIGGGGTAPMSTSSRP